MVKMRTSLRLTWALFVAVNWCLGSSPASAQPTQPTQEELRSKLKEWFEQGKEKDVQASKQWTFAEDLLALVDLKNGELTYDEQLGRFRWVCELNPGYAESTKTAQRETIVNQLTTLMKHEELGFLRQILPQYPRYDLHLADGANAFEKARRLSVALLGPLAEQKTPTQEPGKVDAPKQGGRAEAPFPGDPSSKPNQKLEPQRMPQGACNSSACGCGPVIAESVCVACRHHRCGLRHFHESASGCGTCGPAVICSECQPAVASPQPATQKSVQKSMRTAAAQPASAISAANILRHAAAAQDQTMMQYVSLSTQAPQASPAEARVASEMYSIAFHAFWSGAYRQALEQLEQAVRVNGQDARIWYYKGFTEAALGDGEAAHRSLACAVRLHRRAKADARSINVALERIQGDLRRELLRAYVMTPEVSRDAAPQQPIAPRDKLARAK